MPDFPLNDIGDWIPHEVLTAAKQRGAEVAVSWREISELCGFPSIAHVNRALRLTGSQRIVGELACPADTAKMLNISNDLNIFVPDEGKFSPLIELTLVRFLRQLGHDEVVVASHFGVAPRRVASETFSLPDCDAGPEIHAPDRSIFLAMYVDYHYFLVCQTERSKSAANPMDFFEGFFAVEETNDLWGVGDLDNGLNDH